MLTIAWDVDDVLNDLMGAWLKDAWLPAHPECTLAYDDLHPTRRMPNSEQVSMNTSHLWMSFVVRGICRIWRHLERQLHGLNSTAIDTITSPLPRCRLAAPPFRRRGRSAISADGSVAFTSCPPVARARRFRGTTRPRETSWPGRATFRSSSMIIAGMSRRPRPWAYRRC